MTETVVVREFARLTTSKIESTLDRATVSASAFDWLCNLASQFRTNGAHLLQVENTQWLRLDNFVGIIETPCGTTLEILPKYHDTESAMEDSRALLARMIQAALDLPARWVGTADIALFKAPLSEWVRHQFLLELKHLVKRGMRFDYLQIDEEQRHLRGQLNVVRQLRQPPDRAHYFHTRHAILALDFAENRLIKSALSLVAKSTKEAANWRLSHELLQMLTEVPSSRDYRLDFSAWRRGRLMAHYANILPWCQLILGQHLPIAVQGSWHGMSMLFPMEKLFERFVETAIRRQMPKSMQITSQARESYMCQHNGRGFFQLRPDLLIQHNEKRVVLDVKWKRLNQHARVQKYDISQSDFYQLFAYGHKYFSESQVERELVLIYPKTTTFTAPLAPFAFESSMMMWVLPFDMGTTWGSEKLILADGMFLLRELAEIDRRRHLDESSQ